MACRCSWQNNRIKEQKWKAFILATKIYVKSPNIYIEERERILIKWQKTVQLLQRRKFIRRIDSVLELDISLFSMLYWFSILIYGGICIGAKSNQMMCNIRQPATVIISSRKVLNMCQVYCITAYYIFKLWSSGKGKGKGWTQEGHWKVIYGWWMVDGGIPFPDALH